MQPGGQKDTYYLQLPHILHYNFTLVIFLSHFGHVGLKLNHNAKQP